MTPGPTETEWIELDPNQIDGVIFDLGGVLLPLHQEAMVSALSELFDVDATRYYGQLAHAELFDRHERGQISSGTFRRELAKLLQTEANPEGASTARFIPEDAKIDSAWSALLGRLPEATVDFLKNVRDKTRTFLLSNTNEVHIERFLADYARDHQVRFGPFEELFEHVHYSHELGMRKPEPAIYQHLLDLHGLEAGRTVFIDDSESNAATATQLGLLGIHHPRNAPVQPYFARF